MEDLRVWLVRTSQLIHSAYGAFSSSEEEHIEERVMRVDTM
jgi:hypothetical protein